MSLLLHHRLSRLATALGAVGAVLLAAGAAAEPPMPAGNSGMVTYRDPATGQLTAEPPTGTPLPGPAVSNSAAGLVERPGTTPAGGYLLDLQGRFMNTMTTTKDADGRTHVDCVVGTPAATE
jgi:hypothetical protein